MADDGEKITMLGKRSGYWGERKQLDTVVFVHGLKGHYQNTWGKFPELLEQDPSMPAIDILLWGYKTKLIWKVDSPTTLGKHLISEVAVQTSDGNGLFFVGHSMGGFVLLEGLVGAMQNRKAQEHPSKSVDQISLFASPVSGVSAAAIATNTLGKVLFLRKIFNKQIRALARGEGCDTLLNQVESRIYKPTSEDTSARQIPIRMIMATNDGAVSETDRDGFKARFSEMQALEFEFGHSDVKEPESRYDKRYKALANDVQDKLAARFGDLCKSALNGTEQGKYEAEFALDVRYGELLRNHFTQAGGDLARNWGLYLDYLDLVKMDGAHNSRPASETAVRATMALKRAGKMTNV